MSLDKLKKKGILCSSKISLVLFALLLFGFALSGCDENDAELLEEVGGTPEKQDNQLFESQILALQTLVGAMDGSRTISKITQTNTEYTIIFNDGTSVEIKNGKEGESVPGIGVSLDGGIYYWSRGTGRWLTDNSGNKIPVSGKTAVTPKINQKEGYWYVSVDNGISWERLGEVATSVAGGSSFFESIIQSGDLATVTLKDGTKFQVPMTEGLKIQLSTTKVVIKAGVELKVAYELLNVEGSVNVEILESDAAITATVVNPSATKGEITLLAADVSAIDEFTKVVIKATDSARSATATITFDEEGVLNVAETYPVDATGQLLSISVETNLSYTFEIEKGAQTWLSHQPKTRALHTETEVFKIEANDTGEERTAIIIFKGGDIERKVAVVQEKNETPEEPGPPVGNVEVDKLYGYATGTTGGAGATAANILHFDNGGCFREFLKSREGKNKDKSPVIIYLSGKFTKADGRDSSSPWFDIKDTENLSIYGVDGFVMENVGFFLNRANNIIIRNIYIKLPKADNGADGISMQSSDRVWVDHCTFESVNQTKDYEDGSCDITHATTNVTVSWCHFIQTQKTCLVGHSNNNTDDVAITATFHHNYFDKSSSRHPRVRFGRAHVYNNYFDEVTTYGVGSAYGAKVLVESNSFNGVVLPTDICTFPAKPSGSSMVSNLQGSVAGYLYEADNEFLNKPEKAGEVYPFINLEWEAYGGNKLSSPLTYADFKPTYDYVVDAASNVPAIVSSSAGAGKLSGYDKAPVEVNNGGFTPGETDPEKPTDPEEPGGSDLENGWKWAAYNNSSADASVASGALTLTANGKFESGNQVFGYVYREVTGDFVATVQIDSYETPGSSNQSLAGLILAPDFSATANNFLHVMAAQGPASAYYRSVRVSVTNASRGTLTAPTVTGTEKVIMKLERSGNACSISYSLDGGVNFGKARTETFADGLPDTVYLGMAVSSGDSSKTATAVFSNFTLNGAAVTF